MPQKNPTNKILPTGYYTINDTTVRLNQGPYCGISFQIGKLKIREDYLTGRPNLLYDYKITDSASFDALVLNTDPKLSRIIAAVIIDEFPEGGDLESIQWHNLESKPSFYET